MNYDSETVKMRPESIAAALKEFNREVSDATADWSRSSLEIDPEYVLEYDDLKALYEISQAVNSTLILNDILDIVMEKSVTLFNAERGFLMLLDENGRLQFKTAHNIRKEQLQSEDMRISTTIADTVVRTGQPIYTSDALVDERFSRKASIIDLNIRSAMCVPLRIKNRIIGVLYLDNSSQANIFLKQDLVLFGMFADQAALAIHNASLYTEVMQLQKHQQNIIANTPIGLLVVDQSGLVTAINEAAVKIFNKVGWPVPPPDSDLQNLKLTLGQLIPAKYRQVFDDYLTAEPRGAREVSRFNVACGHDEIILKLRFCPFDDYRGEKAGHIILLEDITEQVVLEQYLILSEKLIGKGEMAAAIGHELNNYLTVISTNAQLAALNLARGDYGGLQRKIDVIVKNVDRIKRFTDGLMDFSTLESKPVTYELGRLIEDILFLIKPQPKFKRVNIKVDLPSSLPAVFIDVGQIHQVFMNLFINSADVFAEHRSGEGEIEVTAKADSERRMVVVRVSDNGPGIPEEILPRLFEPHLTTKRAGHGLGLSTCLRIMKNHGGKIRAWNSPQGGAIFELELPIAATSL